MITTSKFSEVAKVFKGLQHFIVFNMILHLLSLI